MLFYCVCVYKNTEWSKINESTLFKKIALRKKPKMIAAAFFKATSGQNELLACMSFLLNPCLNATDCITLIFFS